MRSRFVPARVTCGLRATGPGVTWMAITGCLERGWSRPWVCFGLQDGGAGAADSMPGIPDTGAHTSVSMAALTMVSATAAWDLGAASGGAGTSTTTAR